MSDYLNQYDAFIQLGASYHINQNKQKMRRDLLVALALFAFGAVCGVLATVAIIPPKVTHEVYLYRPKVKGSDRVEFNLTQIESDTVAERSMLYNLFHRKKSKP